MSSTNRLNICTIGAGPSGITTAKGLKPGLIGSDRADAYLTATFEAVR